MSTITAPAIVDVTTSQQLVALLNTTPGTVIVDYWAPWCAPCRQIAPVLQQLATERGDVTLAKVNIEQATALAQQQQLMSVPTLDLHHQGRFRMRLTGPRPRHAIIQAVNEAAGAAA